MTIKKKDLLIYLGRPLKKEEYLAAENLIKQPIQHLCLKETAEDLTIYHFYLLATLEEGTKPSFSVFIKDTSDLTAFLTKTGYTWRTACIDKVLEVYTTSGRPVLLFARGKGCFVDDTLLHSLYKQQTSIREARVEEKHKTEVRQLEALFEGLPEDDPTLMPEIDAFKNKAFFVSTTWDKTTQKGYCSFCLKEQTFKNKEDLLTCCCCKKNLSLTRIHGYYQNLEVQYFMTFQRFKNQLIARVYRASFCLSSLIKPTSFSFKEEVRILIDRKTGSSEVYIFDYYKRGSIKTWRPILEHETNYLHAKITTTILCKNNLKKTLKGSFLETSKLHLYANHLDLPFYCYLKPLASWHHILGSNKMFALLNTKKIYSAKIFPLGEAAKKEGSFATTLNELLNVPPSTARNIKTLNPTISQCVLLLAAAKHQPILSVLELSHVLKYFSKGTLFLLKHQKVSQIMKYVDCHFKTFNRIKGKTKKGMLHYLAAYIQNQSSVDLKSFYPKDLLASYQKVFYDKDLLNPLSENTLKWVNTLFEPRFFASSNSTRSERKTFSVLDCVGNKTFIRVFNACKGFDEEALSPFLLTEELLSIEIDTTKAKSEQNATLTFSRFNKTRCFWDKESRIIALKNIYLGQFLLSKDLKESPVLYPGSFKHLKGSFFKYCGLEALKKNVNILDYLILYMAYPSIEYIVKSPFQNLIYSFLEQLNQTKGKSSFHLSISSTAKNLKETLRLSTYYKNQYLRLDLTLDDLPYLQELSNSKIQVSDDTLKYSLNSVIITPSNIVSVLRFTTVEKLEKYILEGDIEEYEEYDFIACQHKVTLWLDYNRMVACVKEQYAKEGKTLVSFSKFPKDLEEAHDAITLLYKVANQQKLNEKIALLTKNWEKLSFKDEKTGLLVTYPRSVQEIIQEGDALRHCVKSYGERVAKEETTILFVRAINEPSKSLYTLEYRNGEVVQFRGFANQKPQKEASLFIEKWKNYLSRTSVS